MAAINTKKLNAQEGRLREALGEAIYGRMMKRINEKILRQGSFYDPANIPAGKDQNNNLANMLAALCFGNMYLSQAFLELGLIAQPTGTKPEAKVKPAGTKSEAQNDAEAQPTAEAQNDAEAQSTAETQNNAEAQSTAETQNNAEVKPEFLESVSDLSTEIRQLLAMVIRKRAQLAFPNYPILPSIEKGCSLRVPMQKLESALQSAYPHMDASYAAEFFRQRLCWCCQQANTGALISKNSILAAYNSFMIGDMENFRAAMTELKIWSSVLSTPKGTSKQAADEKSKTLLIISKPMANVLKAIAESTGIDLSTTVQPEAESENDAKVKPEATEGTTSQPSAESESAATQPTKAMTADTDPHMVELTAMITTYAEITGASVIMSDHEQVKPALELSDPIVKELKSEFARITLLTNCDPIVFTLRMRLVTSLIDELKKKIRNVLNTYDISEEAISKEVFGRFDGIIEIKHDDDPVLLSWIAGANAYAKAMGYSRYFTIG